MREIKFRVWNKVDKEMSDSFTLEGMYEAGAMGHKRKHPKNKYIIMQYTGLKDKNGKRIYEGDIISLNNKNYEPENDLYYEGIAVIESTEDLGYHIRPIKPIPPEWSFDSTSMWHVGEGNTTKIIGNKFENPDLMK